MNLEINYGKTLALNKFSYIDGKISKVHINKVTGILEPRTVYTYSGPLDTYYLYDSGNLWECSFATDLDENDFPKVESVDISSAYPEVIKEVENLIPDILKGVCEIYDTITKIQNTTITAEISESYDNKILILTIKSEEKLEPLERFWVKSIMPELDSGLYKQCSIVKKYIGYDETTSTIRCFGLGYKIKINSDMIKNTAINISKSEAGKQLYEEIRRVLDVPKEAEPLTNQIFKTFTLWGKRIGLIPTAFKEHTLAEDTSETHHFT